ncbi:hypothetical protein [Pseudomonas sp. 2FG]|uniref:hypothetical protein n=1 Tax=Pseudomonas sp. 2FG TaxID=2502191 RepID=UPI001485AEE5|nr:hypothetical protein [Pseudomonas sp. 2FG]
MSKTLHLLSLFALNRLSEAQQIANRGLSLIAPRPEWTCPLYSFLAFSGGQAGLNLVTLALSRLPVRRGHLRLNPLV